MRIERSEDAAKEPDRNPPELLSLVASAISGRALQVARGEPGGPAWTDGSVVFVDPRTGARQQVEALAVQASLLAAGSLDPEIVRAFVRRPKLARRYLAIEGHRALAEMADLLPPSLRSLADGEIAARADSPAASLAVARRRGAGAEPPEVFGAIRTRRLLAQTDRAERASPPGTTPRQALRQGLLAELAEDGTEHEGGRALDLFSNPDGRGGALGRILSRMLSPVRQLREGGPVGADAPTHRASAGKAGPGGGAISTGAAGAIQQNVFERRGAKYPEWDLQRRRYRPDWCTVHEIEPRPDASAAPAASDAYGLRRPLARLGLGLGRYRRQTSGDDIDIDAAIEARVEALAGSAPDEAFYVDSLRLRRDLSVLVLLDISGSSAEPAATRATGRTVHQQQRGVAAALITALHDIGDRVALYGFRSQGRSAVHLVPVKRFDDTLDAAAMRRLHGIVPGMYSRLGAAIRHGACLLKERGGTARRLLVVLSDGLAYDHGYEPAYGAADARRALGEARREGIGCLCLSIGASTDVETLHRVFGSAAHATIPVPTQLCRVIAPLFRSALRSAEVARRVPA